MGARWMGMRFFPPGGTRRFHGWRGRAPLPAPGQRSVRGRFLCSFLAENDVVSFAWCQDFIEMFLSWDAARFGITLLPEGLRRFWTMLAHLLGGPLHAAENWIAPYCSTQRPPVVTWISSAARSRCVVSHRGWSSVSHGGQDRPARLRITA